jgi:hypothetical protein
MSIFRRKGWGDQFDAAGAIVGFLLFVIFGLLLGSFAGWLAALALGIAAMNVTALIMRRRAGAQPPQPGVTPEELAGSVGPRAGRGKQRAPSPADE